MRNKVILTWRYEPADFLEEGYEAERVGYSLSIGEGNARATVDLAFFEEHPQLHEELDREIRGRLLSAQLERHGKFDLKRDRKERFDSDGKRTSYLEGAAILRGTALFGGDFQVLDVDGNIIFDGKRERLDRQARRGELIQKHRGHKVLNALLESFNRAMDDPDNEFVHLYEIRDALLIKLGKHGKYPAGIGIDETRDDQFSRLCNNKQIRQGRHRGQVGEELRDATAAELKKARDYATELIDVYLRYLEGGSG